MSIPKQRFLLVSDMHYTTENTLDELKKQFPHAIASAAAGPAFGKTQREKVEKIYGDILTEHKRGRLDGVLVLGDLSIDDYGYRNLPINYCRKFREDCLDRLPCPAYAIPGNHDSYPDAVWRETFGYGRQLVTEFGNTVFLTADTFAPLPAKDASGSPHIPPDEAFLRKGLAAHKGKTIFLCAHYFDSSTFSDSTREMLRENDDIVCLFRGHTHISSVTDLGASFGEKPLIDIGGYGYSGQIVDGRWDFSVFDPAWAWGYQIVEIYDNRIRTYHVRTENEYVATNGIFRIPETVTEEREYRM